MGKVLLGVQILLTLLVKQGASALKGFILSVIRHISVFVWGHVYVSAVACGDQDRVLDPLELELPSVV